MAADDGSGSTSLVRKRTDTELMPPPPAPRQIKRPKTVLDEDTYADGLSRIIARDFFPGLVESETQNEYLDALASKDGAWISSAGQRLKETMTPGRRRRGQRSQTPSLRSASVTPGPGETPQSYAGDTPASTWSDRTAGGGGGGDGAAGAEEPKKAAVDTDVSLGAFQARYTSEDNESFYRLLDRQNEKRAEKHAWLWNGNKLPSNMQRKQKEVEDRLRASGSRLVDDGFKKERQAIRDRDDRPAAPDSWKFSAKSALMFSAEGVADGVETVAQRAQAASHAPPKAIVYANTRLPGLSSAGQQQQQQQPAGEQTVPPSPTLSAVRDAIAGRPRRSDRDSTSGTTTVAGGGGETPRVNGYAFVDDEPETPAEPAEPAEMMVHFERVDASPNPFQLQAKSPREGLHHRMVERIAQSKRTSARVGLTGRVDTSSPALPYPNSPRVRGNLTPAGQRLWSKIGSARRDDAVSAFNASGSGPRNPLKGSRRARLREQRSIYR